MPASPTELRAGLRRLADWPATDLPVISAYLDLRPQATVGDPRVRSGLVVLRDRLRQLERELTPRTPAHASFIADIERIDRHITEERLPDVQCLCLFACHGQDGAFEVLETSRDVDDEVDVNAQPRLLQLARLADEDAALVAVADTNTLRLFALRSGALEEVGLLDDETDDYRQTSGGGWSQARFQRHVEEHRDAFAQLAATAIDDVRRREEAQVVALAADEVVQPLLIDALSPDVAEMTHTGLRIDMRAPIDEVDAEARPFLAALRAESTRVLADELVGRAESSGLAVTGAEATMAALQRGQVAELVVDDSAQWVDQLADDMIRLAAATDARIRFAPDHPGLRAAGGVGGTLRFSLEQDVSDAQSGGRRDGATVIG
jgi:peptide chain release factor subunit 1